MQRSTPPCQPKLVGWMTQIDALKSSSPRGGMEELCGEMQVAMTSMVADFKKELQVLQASEAAKDGLQG